MSEVASDILFGGCCLIHDFVVTCPDCGEQVFCDSVEHDSKTGLPVYYKFSVQCCNDTHIDDLFPEHEYEFHIWANIFNNSGHWISTNIEV